MRTAFKEWAIVVDALGRGEQMLILRKGGLAEERDGFAVEHPEFFLFPTLHHQQRESVVEGARERYDRIVHQFAPPEVVRIEFQAEVAAWRRVESLSAAEALRGQHIWRDEVVAERFEWGKEKHIHALALRVRRLPLPIELPMAASYGGCRSWVELEKGIPLTGAVPVLDQVAFDHKLQQFFSALNPAVAPEGA